MEIVFGFMVAVAYVVSPGPVNVETLRRGLTGGFRVALAMQLGAIIGRVCWAALALAGVGLLMTQSVMHTLLGVVGAALLMYLGWSALCSWRGLVEQACPCAGALRQTEPTPFAIRQSFWIGLGLAVANPLAPAFWLTVSGSISQLSQADAATFLCGFVLGVLLSSLLVALLAGQWRTRLNARIIRLALSACGVVLITFGLSLGYATLIG